MKEEMINYSMPIGEDWEFDNYFYPVFEQKWRDLVDNEADLEWDSTWALIWEPVWLEVSERVWTANEFNYDDWRSEFDMTYDGWYEDYDWNTLFHY